MREVYMAKYAEKALYPPKRKSFCFIELCFEKEVTIEEVEELGKDLTPRGYIFMGVTKKFQVLSGKVMR